MTPVRRCAICKEEKPADHFYRTGSYCKPCGREFSRKYAREHREERRLYGIEWNAQNRDLKRKLDREWVEKNRERKLAINRKWQKKTQLDSGHRGRAKKFGVKYTPINKLTIFERDLWICGLCREPVDKDIPWPDLLCATLDHIIPMSRGGDHVESNVQLAHFLCNLMKRNEAGEEMSDEV